MFITTQFVLARALGEFTSSCHRNMKKNLNYPKSLNHIFKCVVLQLVVSWDLELKSCTYIS